MKFTYKILIALLILFASCSTDENKNEVTKYSVTIEQSDCGGIKSVYCISETEKDRIQILMDGTIGDPCVWISIKDINGSSHSGYYRSSGTDSDGVCD